ncbi:MAG: lipid-A-disaccharide synthase N-terminal domain-containing protein [Dechloromonas sp.]|nr:lipid-A-disaccharide synthase N-terminal domain-containing protein [Dechloromonas sp.]
MAEGGVSAWVWIAIGFGGQALFMMRFVIQWWSSERAGQVVIPVAFWYFSLAGGLVLTVYAIHRDDPVFIFGQALSLVIYARNLHLHYRGKGRSAAS